MFVTKYAMAGMAVTKSYTETFDNGGISKGIIETGLLKFYHNITQPFL